MGSTMPKSESPKEIKPWERRPWPEGGDENKDALYRSVGEALSSWERFEGIMSLLFSAFVGVYDTKAAQRAYASIRTFEGRAEMMRAATEAYFSSYKNDELLQLWKNILSRCTNFSKRRNEIAHGVVDFYYLTPKKEVIVRQIDYALYPSFSSFKDRDLSNEPEYCMTSKEILYFSTEFEQLNDDASLLYGKMLRVTRR
jgi:hypothetical protein